MTYFAASLAFLVAGLALVAGGFGFPSASVEAPDTLVVVHVLAIGWLGLLFLGALLQFIPVLVASPLRLAPVAGPALVAILSGLFCLIAGFLTLGGHVETDLPLLPAGALLLALGFGALIAAFAATVLSQRPLELSARLVLAGTTALAVTVGLGSLFAIALSGRVDSPLLYDLVTIGVPFHAAFGILGWMTLTAIGVSYRLFSMFMLAPERGSESGKAMVGAAAAGLAMLALALVLDQQQSPAAPWVSAVAAVLGLAVGILYFRDVLAMFRARRRKQLELNSLAGLVSVLFLAAGLALIVAAMLVGGAASLSVAAYYLLAMGWLSGLGLAQLYKIVPFLTWLECYGPVMGKAPVPRVQDLVDERRARYWFVLYFVATAAGCAFLLAAASGGFRATALLQVMAVIGLVSEYWRARRLSYAPGGRGLGAEIVRPRLILPSTHIKE
jgi:hypothetical protein